MWDDALADRCCIPECHRRASLAQVPDAPYRDEFVAYLKALRKNILEAWGLYIYGYYGVGKSALGCIALHHVVKIQRTGLFVMAKSLPEMMIEGVMFDDVQTYAQRVMSVDMLVIDEWLVQKDKRDRLVEEVVRDRHSKGKPSIITTNHSPAELKGTQGKPPLSVSMANFLQEAVISLHVEGKDFRAEIRRNRGQ